MVNPQSILTSLSPERLEAFRRTPTDGTEELLACYFWNVRLTEALYPALATLEVVLRNRISQGTQAIFGENWLLEPENLLNVWDQQRVREAVDNLKKPPKKEVTTGRLIAELSFGFWTGLLSREYEQILWPRLTKRVFANAPTREQYRKHLFHRFRRIRDMRNRAFHHEPIWKGLVYNQKRYPLDALHREILTLIGWMDPEILQRLEALDRFPAVWRDKF